MLNKILSIPIDSIELDFEEFLTPDTNKRIIFSGPFGIGKTYFLDKFFKSRKLKYLPIFLRPVNYSLLSNEDVFRLIKYDILLQLINTEGFKIENEFTFSSSNYTKSFIDENGFLILFNLLKLLPKIQSTLEGIEKLGEILEAYKKGKANLNKHPDIKMLFEFQHETQENFLLEYDHVSQFIDEKLEEIVKSNGSNDQLKKVLIIDDLDRLDPEHIFRLFNVFSAHFDHVNYYSNGEDIRDNKFGFDKIIFVCDIENIRKLFVHKYGLGVDFSGYIDKFYSQQIYYILHKNSFRKYIQNYIEEQFNRLPLNNNLQNRNILFYILQVLFDGNQLNIRDIIRFGNINLSDLITKDKKIRNIEVQLDKIGAPIHSFLGYYPICNAIYILSKLFGNGSIFLEKFNKALAFSSIETNDNEFESFEFLRLMPMLILFADYKNHMFKVKNGKESKLEIQNTYELAVDLLLTYKIHGRYISSYHYDGPMLFEVVINENNVKISKAMFLKTLASASKTILEMGLINI